MPGIGLGISNGLTCNRCVGRGLVPVNMYRDISTTGSTIGSTTVGRSWILSAQDTFIRQNGNVEKIRMLVQDDVSPLTQFYFYIWRLRPDLDYDKIHQVDILSKVQEAGTGIVEIEFDTPLLAQEGDRVGLGYGGAENVVINRFPSDISTAKPFLYQNTIISDSVYDWNAAPSIQISTEIVCFMSPPNIVGVGDSIMAGHPGHYSYIETTLTFSDDIENQVLYQLANLNSLYAPYQNMGIGGNRVNQVLARLQEDAVDLKPKRVLLNAGVNDIAGGRSNNDIMSDIDSSVQLLISNGIAPMLIQVIPWSNGTNVQMQQRDLLNVEIQNLASLYNLQTVNLDIALGQFRSGGDPGNLWDINPLYDDDGVHLNKDGYIAYATEVNSQL